MVTLIDKLLSTIYKVITVTPTDIYLTANYNIHLSQLAPIWVGMESVYELLKQNI
jgi:hypothetical protein